MSEHFYADLPILEEPIGSVINRYELFRMVPSDWGIVVADIRASSIAVAEGLHRTVNLIATGSIVCVLNIAHARGVVIPFFFGGDGATFLIPGHLVDQIMETLWLYRGQITENFGLTLRIGHVPVKEIYAAGHDLKIAKYGTSPRLVTPLIIGNGLNYAEQLIKAGDKISPVISTGRFEVDLSGLQCRWDHITPPNDQQEVVSLLVSASNVNDQGPAFAKVLNALDRIYGLPKNRQPISESKLRINATFRDVGRAILIREGHWKWHGVLLGWLSMVYGHLFLQTKRGKDYLEALVEMSVTIILDGRINTIMSGTADQREKLLSVLKELELAGEIFYGMHVSNASVMSCYVPDHMDGHIHFVDGFGGGFTQASRVLKGKMNH